MGTPLGPKQITGLVYFNNCFSTTLSNCFRLIEIRPELSPRDLVRVTRDRKVMHLSGFLWPQGFVFFYYEKVSVLTDYRIFTHKNILHVSNNIMRLEFIICVWQLHSLILQVHLFLCTPYVYALVVSKTVVWKNLRCRS